MSPQLYYLAVDWAGAGRPSRLTVASEPIALERAEDGNWWAETEIFHDTLPWIGLRAIDADELAPSIVLPSGERHAMVKVDMAGQDAFWIEHGEWDPSGSRHLSALHRESGQVMIEHASTTIVLDHTMGGAGRLNEYLADFRDEFVWLVLGANAKVRGTVAAGGSLNLELATALTAFSLAARAIVDRPEMQIRETIAPSRATRVRPTAATFRHYVRDPAARSLPSRQAVESLDTPENRYLRLLVANALRLASSAAPAFVRSAERFRAIALVEAARANTLGSTQWRIVDPDVLDSQLAERKRLVESILGYTDGPFQETTFQYAMAVKNVHGGKGGGHYYEHLNRRAESPANANYAVVRFDTQLTELISAIRAVNSDFVVVGQCEEKLLENWSGKKFYQLNFTHVSSIRMRKNIVRDGVEYRQKLEANGWRTPISASERRELVDEAASAKLRAVHMTERADEIADAAIKLTNALQLLQSLDARLSKAGVAIGDSMPMGQRYLQSPRYASGLSAYRALETATSQNGIGSETLDRLEEVGVLHASALYERWCLVRIFSVLIEDYHFRPPLDWQARLVSLILDRKPGTVDLHRMDANIFARVQYQVSLTNGRRPDFIISFQREDEPLRRRSNGLVLDAKFRTRWKSGALPATVNSLCDEKRYNIEDDKVFVLHPVPESNSRPTSPLTWGRNCDYGQDKQRHRRGSIALSSGANSQETRLNLKRLIAMQLQATLDQPPSVSESQDQYARQVVCIECGAQHSPGDLRNAVGRSGWDLKCRSCRFTSWRTYCYNCNYPIFKNGVQMTYHRTLANQITNVACSNCGYHFDNFSVL